MGTPQVSGREESIGRWRRWEAVWHVVFYGSLAAVPLLLLPDRDVTALQWTVVAAASATWAAWYAWWLVAHQDAMASSARDRAVYFSGAAVLFASLLWVHPAYAFLMVPLVAQVFGYLTLRAAVLWVLGGAVLMTASDAAEGSGLTLSHLSWSDAVGPGITSGLALAIALYIRAVASQSRERQELIETLEATRQELAVAERSAGMLEERQRLAAEIHDTLAQGFTSIVMLLEAAEASLDAGSPGAVGHIEQALATARSNLGEVRRLVWALRPEALEQRTLPQALTRLTGDVAAQTEITARTVVTGEPRPLLTAVEDALFRSAQEALANARRHARPRTATVTLSYMEDVVTLDVRDDGIGFDPGRTGEDPDRAGGFGLLAMRQRVEALKGSMMVESARGDGTTVVVQLPVEPGGSPPATAPEPARPEAVSP